MVERIRQLCKERGTNFNQLEKATGQSKGSIAKWDTNCPSADKVAKVAAFFGVTCDYIING